jgi:thiamine biosynthesis lipoprotein
MKFRIIVIGLIAFLLAGCSGGQTSEKERYSSSFFDTFDTLVQVVAYTDNEDEFDGYMTMIHDRFLELHKLYNIYLDYEGINNIKTINDNAGLKPVLVEQEIIDLIIYSREMYEKTGYTTNIALGPVLKIWRHYREEAEYDPESARIPPLEELREAALYTDLDQVIVDPENRTVYLPDPRMSLDVGAVAKGFATEIVAQELKEAGLRSAVLSPGGNIRTIGRPLDGIRDKWGVGIQNPEASIVAEDERLLDVVFVQDAAVVSSGDYQRYYLVDGQVMHHIIDVNTLMPGNYYRALTVVCSDAALADFLSTALFLMPFEESKAMAENFEGVEVYWVFHDGRIEITDGLKSMLRSYGATNELE